MSTAEGGGNIVTDGLVLLLDAANTKSYVSGSTIWNDLSRSGNNGSLINGPTFNSLNGGSIVFDGSNDFIEGTITVPTSFTFNVWLKMTSYGLYAPEFNIWPIYGGNRGWGIFSFVLGSSGGYIGTDVATRFIPSDLIGFYNLNIIQNLSFSYGSGIGTLYKNGVFFKSKSMTAPGYVGQLKT